MTPAGSSPATRSDAVSERSTWRAVAGCPDPGGPVDVGADVLAIGIKRPVAGVHAHPNANLGAFRPWLGGEPTLGVDRGGDAGADPREDREDPVALGLVGMAAGGIGSPRG